jgi:hypothetical protein
MRAVMLQRRSPHGGKTAAQQPKRNPRLRKTALAQTWRT